jgi:hypothetical protein
MVAQAVVLTAQVAAILYLVALIQRAAVMAVEVAIVAQQEVLQAVVVTAVEHLHHQAHQDKEA